MKGEMAKSKGKNDMCRGGKDIPDRGIAHGGVKEYGKIDESGVQERSKFKGDKLDGPHQPDCEGNPNC
jgi:hypothetical protein